MAELFTTVGLTIWRPGLDLVTKRAREAYRPRETRRELKASAKGERKCIQRWCHGGVRATGAAGKGQEEAGSSGCGPGWGARQWAGGYGRGGQGGGADEGDGEGFGGGAFGVRRPLRFLAYKLELDERQVGELARILDELKTERAQAEVDRRRSLSAFADAVAGDTFDDARAKQAAGQRVATAERLRDAVTGALGRLHALLDKDQRERLAYLIRTGVLGPVEASTSDPLSSRQRERAG